MAFYKVQICFRVVACHDPGAGIINIEVFGLADNMRIMICLGQRGLRAVSTSSYLCGYVEVDDIYGGCSIK